MGKKISEAQRKANAKYDKEHMGTIGIKGKKDVINKIKDYAKNRDISINKLCINATIYCIDNGIDLSGDTNAVTDC